jgi:hypothetical protein
MSLFIHFLTYGTFLIMTLQYLLDTITPVLTFFFFFLFYLLISFILVLCFSASRSPSRMASLSLSNFTSGLSFTSWIRGT